MGSERNIWMLTLLLASVAGYCDTVTFVSADELFSAHVTGNFIVFAYDIIRGADLSAWVKLVTFPVFVTSVIVGGYVAQKMNRYSLLLMEAILLLISGIAAYALTCCGFTGHRWFLYPVVMLVVFAMGFQNTFGRLFGKETHGPTTIMTGNVTQISLDTGTLLRTGFKDAAARDSFRKQLITISGFLFGCLFGAIAGKYIGLSSVAFPGLVLLMYIAGLQKDKPE